MPESTDRGAFTEAVFYILLSLHQPMHGYALMKNIADLTQKRVSLGAGTLYGALNTLEKKGLIQSFEESSKDRKKEYIITKLGKQSFNKELVRLRELLKTAEAILGGSEDEKGN